MIVKILGILDVLIGIIFLIDGIFFKSALLPDKILWIMVIYLMLKGIVFLLTADIASILDIICGIIMILAIFFTLPKIIVAIVSIFLIQKGGFSLLS